MSLVEGIKGSVGEWASGVGIDEDSKREVNGVVFDTLVFVGVGEFEKEDNGVVVVVVRSCCCCCVEGGNVERLKEAFGFLSAECEP